MRRRRETAQQHFGFGWLDEDDSAYVRLEDIFEALRKAFPEMSFQQFEIEVRRAAELARENRA